MNDPLVGVGVGVLGTGVMGQRMIAAMLQRATRLRVAALYDPDGASMRAAAALAPQARTACGPDELVSDPAVRLVYIATPPALHLAGVSASLAAGRACLCEKPLSSDLADALALHRAVSSARLPFAVNFPFASSTSARRLVGIVRSGELGVLQAATIRLRFSRWPRAWQAAASSWLSGAAEGGFTREVLSHFVFLAQRCFGPATVSGVRLQREPGHAETALLARLQHAGIAVQIDAAVAGDIGDDNRFEIIGSRGRVVLSGWSRLDHGGEITDVADGIGNMLLALPGLLAGRTDHGLATVDEALGVVQCVEALLQG
jgi:predicted dehydrogenase